MGFSMGDRQWLRAADGKSECLGTEGHRKGIETNFPSHHSCDQEVGLEKEL